MTIHADQVTLFVIEDDDIDFMAIKRSFKNMKVANPLVRAKNGQEALDMLENKEIKYPFIMLLDLQMPKLSGLELLTQLRASDEFKDIVVFVLTTSSDERDIVASYQQNVAGYFVKDDVGKEFLEVLSLLDGYWRIVHMPGDNGNGYGRSKGSSS